MDETKQTSFLKRWGPWVFYCLAVLLMAVVLMVSTPTPDPDLWGRFSVAALFFQNGCFPYHDVFSFTAPNAPWYDHEWLTGFVLYQITLWTGEPGLVTFKYLSAGAVFWLIFSLHKRCYRTSPLFAFYGLLLLSSIYVIGYYATVRSQIFTFFFYMLALWLLEHVRLGNYPRKALLWLLPMAVVWGNFHGGFIVGVALAGLYGIGEAIRNKRWQAAIPHLAIAAGMFVLLGLINPYGPAYLEFLTHAWTLNRQHIAEWHPIPWDVPLKFWQAKLMVLTAFFLLVCNWRRLKQSGMARWQEMVTPTLVLLWMILFTLKGIRFQTFMALTLVAYLPLLLRDLSFPLLGRLVTSQASLLSRTLPVLIFLLTAGCLIYLGQYQPVFRVRIADEMTQGGGITRYPLGAITFLRKAPYQGNLLNRFGLGEFLYWCLFPRYKVSMDGRYEEVYHQQQFLDNFKFFDKKNPAKTGWILEHPDKIGADFILVDSDYHHLDELLATKRPSGKPTWEQIFADEYFVVLGRTETLEKFPPYNPMENFMTTEIKTIGDYFTPEDLNRFKLKNKN